MNEDRELVLALDTSLETSSAALLYRTDVLRSSEWVAGRKHSMHLEPNVRAVVGTELGNIGIVAVAAGPGGFSSLRTSMAFAKGLCSALKIGFISVSPHLALAYSSQPDRTSILTLIPAATGQYFTQTFERLDRPHPNPLPEGDGIRDGSLVEPLTEMEATHPGSIEAVSECRLVPTEALHELISGPVFVAGNVSEQDLKLVRDASEWPIEIGAEVSDIGLARYVGLAGRENPGLAGSTTAIAAVPTYMRSAGVTAPVRGWARA